MFSAGLGLAAGYIEDHLQDWGVKPAGDARHRICRPCGCSA